jgi:hypothetical protein
VKLTDLPRFIGQRGLRGSYLIAIRHATFTSPRPDERGLYRAGFH